MDRKETKEKIAVMQAYIDGKEIESRHCASNNWHTVVYPRWEWGEYDYRVKPEPRYVPFDTTEECWQAIQKHGQWVMNKDKGWKALITGCKKTLVVIDGSDCCLDWMFLTHTFIDGTPFGKEVSEETKDKTKTE